MRRALLAAALLLAGCAYNAMYHARRLSGDAEKAERDGRTIDANAFWGQVTVKAETQVARYPDSKYSTEARLLLAHLAGDLSKIAWILHAVIHTIAIHVRKVDATLLRPLLQIAA